MKAPATHIAQLDGPADFHGKQYCICGLVEDHKAHHLPPTPAEARQRDAAVLGEHEEEL